MSLLAELKAILDELKLPNQTAAFHKNAPELYAVLTPLDDDFPIFGDDYPTDEVQKVRISLFSKGNYRQIKKRIVMMLLKADITVSNQRFIEYETDTGYHHYNIDTAKNYEYEMEDE